MWGFFLSTLCATAQQTPVGVFTEATGTAEITDLSGKVVASIPFKSKLREIKKDAPFYESETISTGPTGKLRLRFAEGSNEVYVGPNTKLVIQKSPSDLRMKRGTKLFLDAGFIDSNIRQKYSGKDGDEFSVETRTLVAGVRGTEFQVSHLADVSKVSVKSGIVEVRSIGDLILRDTLKAGESIDSTAWKSAAKAQPAKPSTTTPVTDGTRN